MADKKEEQKVETTGKVDETKKAEDRALETPKKEEGVLAKIVARNEGQVETQSQHETKPDVPVVTEEMVKEYPALKTLIGKPVTEIMKSHAALNTRLSQSENELNTLKSGQKKEPEKKDEKPVSGSQTTKSVEEEIDELIEKTDLPDPIDDPKAYAKASARLNAKIAAIQAKHETAPLRSMQEEHQKSEEARVSILKAEQLVKQKLPEDVDMEAIKNGFQEYIAPVIAENPTLFHGKPELLASEIAAWYYSEENKRLKAGATEDSRTKTRKDMRDMREKIEGAPSGEKRAETVRSEDSGLSPALQKIVERNEGKMPTPGVRGR